MVVTQHCSIPLLPTPPLTRPRYAAHPAAEPWLAHTAEKHAAAVAESITAAVRAAAIAAIATPLFRSNSSASTEIFARALATAHAAQYPQVLTGVATAPVIVAVSLGPHEALVAFDGLTVTGPVGRRAGAVLKRMIEVTKVWQLLGGAVGGAFWRFSDAAANALHSHATRAIGDVDVCC